MSVEGLEGRILDRIQADFPIESRPFRALAAELGCTEDDVLSGIQELVRTGLVRRLGPVFDLKRLGHTSTLCAARAAPQAVEAVADFISSFDEVTHNYERDHAFNIWFTLIAPSHERIDAILETIRAREGVEQVLSLPASRTFKIKVRFPSRGSEGGGQ